MSLAIRETQIETTASYHFTPMGTVIIFFFFWMENNKCWRGCRETGALLQCWWEYKMVWPLWNIAWQSLKM